MIQYSTAGDHFHVQVPFRSFGNILPPENQLFNLENKCLDPGVVLFVIFLDLLCLLEYVCSV